MSFPCKMNTSFENVVNFEVDETTTLEKVLAFIAWILLQFPCNGMMLGLIQFERLGGDPLKRRLTDQVRKLKNILLLLSFFSYYFLSYLVGVKYLLLVDHCKCFRNLDNS